MKWVRAHVRTLSVLSLALLTILIERLRPGRAWRQHLVAQLCGQVGNLRRDANPPWTTANKPASAVNNRAQDSILPYEPSF